MKKYCAIFLLIINSSSLTQPSSPIHIAGSIQDISMNAVFSPDGNKIAYTKASYKGLWIFDRVTNSTMQITDEDAAGFAFKWSSDSKSILTRVAKYENSIRYNAVKIFDADSGKSLLLTDYQTMMPFLPEWADGETKVILPTKNGFEILNTGKLKKPNTMETQLSSYSRFDKIVINNLLESSEQIIIPIENAEIINLTMSPDNTHIAFEVMGGNLYSMNIDGSNLVDLGKGNRPHWSFDSREIIYMIAEDDGHTFTASDIYSINVDGTEKKNLTYTNSLIEMNPSFSPDGKMIAFELLNDGSIYLMGIE